MGGTDETFSDGLHQYEDMSQGLWNVLFSFIYLFSYFVVFHERLGNFLSLVIWWNYDDSKCRCDKVVGKKGLRSPRFSICHAGREIFI